jgi:hypothetical protein
MGCFSAVGGTVVGRPASRSRFRRKVKKSSGTTFFAKKGKKSEKTNLRQAPSILVRSPLRWKLEITELSA